MFRSACAALLLTIVAPVLGAGTALAGDLNTGWASRLGFVLSTDDFRARTTAVSATPFDPTSLPQDEFFGRERYSSRAVAIELILNAARLRHDDSLVYQRPLNTGYRVTTHWRLRASLRRVLLRYEIRF